MNAWYVVKTKPKKEKDVENHLKAVTFEVFLPMMKAIGMRREARGKRFPHIPFPLASSPCDLKPLFPSYLFVRTDFDDPHIHRLIRFTRGVSKILGDTSGPVPLDNLIIETLMAHTRDGSLIEQRLLFKEGDEVRVKTGILKDLIGIVEKNMSETGRIRILFKWLSGNMKAILRYRLLEKVA